MNHQSLLLLRASLFVLLTGLVLPGFSGAAEVELKLVTAFDFSPGNAANDNSFVRAASPDGRFVVIDSQSNNLAAGPIDVNSTVDVFVLDGQDGSFDLVSLRAGLPARSAEGISHGVAISDDGRWVLFESSARDLIAGVIFPATSGARQVLLFDRATRATQLVSRSRASAQLAGDGVSRAVALSPDGRYALFSSSAANLGGGTEEEVYLYDREGGAHQLVSRSAGPPHTSGNDDSTAVDLSADGRHVLFSSEATNLVAGQIDGRNSSDVFLFDRDSGAIELISRDPGSPLQAVGGSAADLSPDGRFLLLSSPGVALVAGLADGNGTRPDLFLRDRQSGQTRLASPSATVAGRSANGGSQAYRVSDDGRFVYFSSSAGDLVSPFTDGNGSAESDVYLFDAAGGSVTLVSHAAGAPAVGADAGVRLRAVRQNSSADGRYALLETMASNLDPDAEDPAGLDLYLHDRTRGQSTLASRYGGTALSGGAPFTDSDLLAGDGEVFFATSGPLDEQAKDPHQQVDVFRFSGGAAVELITATPLSGRAPLPYPPGTARFGHHPRWALWGPYLHDILTGNREIVAFPAGLPAVAAWAYGTSLSADGRYVLYESSATDTVAGMSDANGGPDLFIYDRSSAAVTLLTHAAGSPLVAAHGYSQAARFSVDGRFAAFESTASDLVAGQAPTDGDDVNVYLHDRASGLASLISHAAGSPLAAADRRSGLVAFDPQGGWLILSSNARNLVPGFVDRNGERQDVYFYDRAAGEARLITRRAGTLAEGSTRTISAHPMMATADGTSVFYTSDADDLALGQIALPGEDKIFRWERATGTSHLETYLGEERGRPCSGSVRFADITADGRFLLLDGTCQLVPGDTNTLSDVYLLDRATRAFILISHAPNQPGASLGTYSRAYEVSDDGRRVIHRRGNVPYSYDRATGEATLLARAYYDPREAAEMTPDFLSSSAGGTRMLIGTHDPRLAPFDANANLDTYLAVLEDIFADGFESGSTAAWSAAVP